MLWHTIQQPSGQPYAGADQLLAAAMIAAARPPHQRLHSPAASQQLQRHSVSHCSCCGRQMPNRCGRQMQEAQPSCHAHDHGSPAAAIHRLHLIRLRFGVSLDNVKPILCALAQCRELYGSWLTGTLPAAWSAMTSLYSMWVSPLVPSCCGCSAVCDAHADGQVALTASSCWLARAHTHRISHTG